MFWTFLDYELTDCKTAELTPEALEFLKVQSNGLVTHTINLDYDYWTAGILHLYCIFPFLQMMFTLRRDTSGHSSRGSSRRLSYWLRGDRTHR